MRAGRSDARARRPAPVRSNPAGSLGPPSSVIVPHFYRARDAVYITDIGRLASLATETIGPSRLFIVRRNDRPYWTRSLYVTLD